MKNIAIIIPDLIGGGAERAAANLSIELSKYYKVKVILFRNEKIMYPIGGELIVLDEPSKKNVLQRLFVFWKRVNKLRKIKRLNGIETSISFKEGASLVNILSKSKDKVIISIRTFHYKEKYHFLDRMRINFMYAFFNRADKIVSVSKLIEEDLIKNYHIKKHKVQTVYNYYNIHNIEKLSEETTPDHADLFNNPVVITAGRLTYQKCFIICCNEEIQRVDGAHL
jgi:glycosyltransferase involved in cell wall biosynthesis